MSYLLSVQHNKTKERKEEIIKDQMEKIEGSQTTKAKKVISLKAMLKEKEPQKITRAIERIESSEEKIDEYVSRITGVSTQVITTTRN